MPENKMSKSDAGRVQSTQAKSGADVGAGTFAARAQSAGDRNANAQGSGSGNTGGQSGSGTSGDAGKK
ncbi:hypothetical protein E4U42_006560 [Claviceps africana]|uniref:SMP domain-containing protein n=1 Tax=Claviceps africana TaxID=83212 RepID=A0A8K0J518_9HYPO|nr:hypothetical protein E4U42_006560 [Claviceps africana]